MSSKNGVEAGAAIERYAAYTHHEMAGSVIGWPQVRHLKRRGKMGFRRSALDPSDQGGWDGHGRRDIDKGWQGFAGGARRERETSRRRKSCAYTEREFETSGLHQQAKLGHYG